MKYGDISLVLCISTRLRLVTILSLLVKYLVIFHADPCNKSYITREISIEHPSVGLASLAQLRDRIAFPLRFQFHLSLLSMILLTKVLCLTRYLHASNRWFYDSYSLFSVIYSTFQGYLPRLSRMLLATIYSDEDHYHNQRDF